MKSVNLKAIIGVSLVCLIFIIAQTGQVSAISVKELLGLKKSETDVSENKNIGKAKNTTGAKNKASGTEWAKTSDPTSPTNPQIDLDYVSLLVSNMNQQEREQVLEDESLFKQVIENEANNRSTLSAAIANNLVEDRNVDFLMRRGAENILRESYLSRLISTKLPKDFPTNEQVVEYFDANKGQFVVPERVHVWQIFFKKSENNKKELAALTKKAESIISSLKKGKADYSNIALSESEHDQSKALGGYMGLLKTSELIPAIKEPILKLKEGEISKPIESEAGVHILKRGKILKPETLELAQVEPQIRELLIKQANAQLRNAIFIQARKEYPQTISDKKLEEWRLRLKTDRTQ